jgi:hypothetical protein
VIGLTGGALAERVCRTVDRFNPAQVCVDHIVVWGEEHLRRVLRAYARYYNGIRTHWSLDKDAPALRSVQWVGAIASYAILGGLHHHYTSWFEFSVHTPGTDSSSASLGYFTPNA